MLHKKNEKRKKIFERKRDNKSFKQTRLLERNENRKKEKQTSLREYDMIERVYIWLYAHECYTEKKKNNNALKGRKTTKSLKQTRLLERHEITDQNRSSAHNSWIMRLTLKNL